MKKVITRDRIKILYELPFKTDKKYVVRSDILDEFLPFSKMRVELTEIKAMIATSKGEFLCECLIKFYGDDFHIHTIASYYFVPAGEQTVEEFNNSHLMLNEEQRDELLRDELYKFIEHYTFYKVLENGRTFIPIPLEEIEKTYSTK